MGLDDGLITGEARPLLLTCTMQSALLLIGTVEVEMGYPFVFFPSNAQDFSGMFCTGHG